MANPARRVAVALRVGSRQGLTGGPVLEAVLVLIGVALLGGVSLAPVEWILDGAAALLVIGFALGVPTGLWYHVALVRAVGAREVLPPRWWLRPTALHDRLRPDERPQVLRWFYAGGLGFAFTALGCVVLGGAALRLALQGS